MAANLTRVLTFIASLTAAASALHAESEIGKRMDKAQQDYEDALVEAHEKANAAYRKSVAEALTIEIKVELYVLGFEMTDVEGARDNPDWVKGGGTVQFPIVPYLSQSKILNRRLLGADEITMLLPSLRRTIVAEENKGGMLCHFPTHGIRVWDKEYRLIFQTSICYHCSNFFMTYPSGRAGWTRLCDPTFREVLEKLMPVPQEELGRFKAKYPDPAEGEAK